MWNIDAVFGLALDVRNLMQMTSYKIVFKLKQEIDTWYEIPDSSYIAFIPKSLWSSMKRDFILLLTYHIR